MDSFARSAPKQNAIRIYAELEQYLSAHFNVFDIHKKIDPNQCGHERSDFGR